MKPLSTAGSSSQPPATVFGYNIVATEAQAVEMNRQAIIEHNGEATSLIQNAECNATDGWTGSGGVSLWGGQNWRGTGDQNDKYLDVGGLSYVQQTLSHMPAGYYKLVAALRAYAGGTITPYLNASAGTSHSGLTYGGAGVSMMNRQGVQMPADANFHGYGEENTRGWQWGTATTQLETDGDLTIRFNLEGGWWKCIDDVHLYYSTTADGFHTISDAANQVPSGKVLTCDIILANPNTIVSSASAIATASGEQLNNNLVDGNISTLVLFDGYNFEQPEDDYTATAATFYRNIPADTWCSLVLPFVPTTEAVYMQPSALNGTVLQFVDATQANDSPVIVRSSSALDAITGSRSTAASGNCTGGSGVPLVGTYEYITAVPYGNYVLGTDNRLYLVDSSVSLNPFRAYFNAASVQGVKASILTMNTDTQTAIDEISLSDTSLQRHSSKTFDLTGRPVQQTHQKGIYVTGRKKVVF